MKNTTNGKSVMPIALAITAIIALAVTLGRTIEFKYATDKTQLNLRIDGAISK